MSNAFTDPQVRPERDTIRTVLGQASGAWDAVNDLFSSAGAAVTWRHYRDGGWLAKVSRKGSTLAWMAVHPGSLQVSFHFAERLRTGLSARPGLAPHLRERLAHAPVSGRLLSISLDVRSGTDVADVDTLLQFKLTAR